MCRINVRWVLQLHSVLLCFARSYNKEAALSCHYWKVLLSSYPLIVRYTLCDWQGYNYVVKEVKAGKLNVKIVCSPISPGGLHSINNTSDKGTGLLWDILFLLIYSCVGLYYHKKIRAPPPSRIRPPPNGRAVRGDGALCLVAPWHYSCV